MKSRHGFETTIERSELMKKIKGINTIPEVMLRKKLWSLGYRYRLNVTKLPGKPDVVINKKKLAIFIDGEFWHGYDWLNKKDKIKNNREYWIKKIEGNIKRDLEQTVKLESMGYFVLRFWEKQIKRDLDTCLEKILLIIK
jgi:DNA mismatch endonuclease (patch repair protein)